MNCCVCGYPILHSLSPHLYTEEFIYKKISTKEIESCKKIAEIFDIKFLNLTSPLKWDSNFFNSNYSNEPYNLVLKKDNWELFNTDSFAIKEIIKPIVNKYKEITVVGSGGIAFTTIKTLKSIGINKLSIAARNSNKLSEIVNKFKNIEFEIIDYNYLDLMIIDSIKTHNVLIINCTPIKLKLPNKKQCNSNCNSCNSASHNCSHKKYNFYEINPNYKNGSSDGFKWLIYQAIKNYEIIKSNQLSQIEYQSNYLKIFNKVKKIKRKNINKIVFSGFMGSGKTSIGKKVANQLNYKYFDLDSYIEKKENMQIKDLFDKLGEAKFRSLEVTYFNEICNKNNIVISLGGGSIINPAIQLHVKNNFLNFLVYRDIEKSYENIKDEINKPLINSLKNFKNLFEERKQIYFEACNIIIHNKENDITNTIEDTLNEIKPYL